MKYDLSKYHKVTCEEFQEFFKTAPKTYPILLESIGVNMADIYVLDIALIILMKYLESLKELIVMNVLVNIIF